MNPRSLSNVARARGGKSPSAFPLRVGVVYLDREGRARTVAGHVQGSRRWIWTLDGKWFRRSDGRVMQRRPDGSPLPSPRSSPSREDLVMQHPQGLRVQLECSLCLRDWDCQRDRCPACPNELRRRVQVRE